MFLGAPEISAYVAMPGAAFWLTYAVFGLGLHLLNEHPFQWYRRRALNGRTRRVPDWRRTLRVLTRNAVASIGYGYVFWSLCLTRTVADGADAWWLSALKIGVSLWISDAYFYHAHRLFHECGWLYRHVHCQHHAYHAPSALLAVDCHVLEMVLVNQTTGLLGPALTGMDCYALTLFLVLACVSTLLEHSGHKWLIDPSHHDRHHALLAGNYGFSRFWDQWYGTLLRKAGDISTSALVDEQVA